MELNRHINQSLREFCCLQGPVEFQNSSNKILNMNAVNATRTINVASSRRVGNVSNDKNNFCYRLRHTSKHDLFCSGACSHAYKMRRSQTKLRSALFSQERGVCRSCGLDCDALLVQLQQLCRGKFLGGNNSNANLSLNIPPCDSNLGKTSDYHSSEKVDSLLRSAFSKAIEIANASHGPMPDSESPMITSILRSITTAVTTDGIGAGHLWQCDHVTEVRDGGGEASCLSELQTLCSICHRVKTQKRTLEGGSLIECNGTEKRSEDPDHSCETTAKPNGVQGARNSDSTSRFNAVARFEISESNNASYAVPGSSKQSEPVLKKRKTTTK